MKYKHVFFVWLLADIILGAGSLIALLVSNISAGVHNGDYGMLLLVFLYGLGISLPSLVIMLLFHYFYLKKSPLTIKYFRVYSLLILGINLLYLLVSYIVFKVQGEFFILYIFTTIAGFIALFLIHQKIKKEQRAAMLA
ncbi:MAG: hypothetical protein IPP48_12330 [Chitinophagaceae bacterium]|nr:hypothetical protein [Chitinophagaceae bacterium]